MKAWAGTGEAYAASYASLCAGTHDALVDSLGAARGRRLLDVGSGTGAFAARLANAGWSVTGCEPEPTMRTVAAREHPQLTVVESALPDLPFADAEFDATTANFVLNHVPDPRAAAREIARATTPGGVLIATTWVVSPSWFWANVCARAELTPATGDRLPPDKDFERTTDGFGRMLSDGGWHDLRLSELSWTWHVEPEALWASAEGGVASAGTVYLALNPHERQRFRMAFDEMILDHASGGVIALDHTAALAVAQADRQASRRVGTWNVGAVGVRNDC